MRHEQRGSEASMPGPQPAAQHKHPHTERCLGQGCQERPQKRVSEAKQDQPLSGPPGWPDSNYSCRKSYGTQQEQEPKNEMSQGQ